MVEKVSRRGRSPSEARAGRSGRPGVWLVDLRGRVGASWESRRRWPYSTLSRQARARQLAADRGTGEREKGSTVVMVVHEAGRVVGYCGLAPSAVAPTLLRNIRTAQPPNPVPCLLLGQRATTSPGPDEASGPHCSSTRWTRIRRDSGAGGGSWRAETIRSCYSSRSKTLLRRQRGLSELGVFERPAVIPMWVHRSALSLLLEFCPARLALHLFPELAVLHRARTTYHFG